MLKRIASAMLVLGITAALAQPSPQSCSALAKASLTNVKILSAAIVEAGAFPPPETTNDAPFYKQLPAFCRVTAQLIPSSDSDIKVELWMPVAAWNGKFRGQGNGGFAGVIDFDNLAVAVSLGYASAGTDTGHVGSGIDATWALHHPEKIIDFGYRAIHEMTQTARTLTARFYDKAPTRSYFAACSDGGREALMEAQRYPDDYDGILAGAPANNWSHLLTAAVNGVQELSGSSYIPAAKLPAIQSAVLAACDKLDGVADGILNDPRTCRFNPSTLLCKSTDTDQCLTAPQAAALKKLYAGTYETTGQLVFPGLLPGAELGNNGWGSWITGDAPGKSAMYAFGTGFFTDMVYSNPNWTYTSFTVDAGLQAAVQKTATALDSTDPNLKPFLSRGKLILYHGWNDPAISALNTVNYFNQVISVTGQQQTNASLRLYMAPGVQHCGEGPGPDSFGQFGDSPLFPLKDPQHNLYAALEQWVEQGTAPSEIIATKYAGTGSTTHVTMTRPLCPYPEAATYKGSGDINNATNFTCTTPK